MFMSFMFYTHDRKFAFQKVGAYYNLYSGVDGEFIAEFTSFNALCDYIKYGRQFHCEFHHQHIKKED